MSLLSYGAAFAAGATLLYCFDPDHGRRRRARLRNEAEHLAHCAARSLQHAGTDAMQRAGGVGARLRQRAASTQAIDDDVLSERVRSLLGRHCSRSSALAISAQAGTVQLRGPILAEEADALLGHVRNVPGVTAVEDALERHEAADDIPALQGARFRPSARRQRRWPISVRWAAGAGGATLAASGLVRRGPLGAGLVLVGTAALLRATSNRSVRALLGLGAGLESGIDITKTIRIDAPVSEVFDYFVSFENFPKFMRHVREVKRLEDNRWQWRVEGPGGMSFEWAGMVTEWTAPSRVSWTSTENAAIRNRGDARFERVSDGATRLTIRLTYEPPLGALGHAVAKLLGADPKRELDDDLLRLKSLLETGKATGREHTVTRSDVVPAAVVTVKS